MKELAEKLKAYITNSGVVKARDTQIGYCETCWSIDEVECVDIVDLWYEIDKFCAEFKDA